MRAHIRKSVSLGELVAAVFEQAAQYSTDPREISRLAALAVEGLLRRARRAQHPPLASAA